MRMRWITQSCRRLAVLCAAMLLAGPNLSGCSTPTAPAQQAPATQAVQPSPQALPSWRDGAARQALLKFVADVTTPGTPNFVPPEGRVAVFDNDGTLWSEQPMYFQVAFLLDQIRAAAPRHPEWRDNPTYIALMANDMAGVMRDQKALLNLIAVANSGMTVDDYDRTIRDWLATARHPKFNRPYTELVFQPQLELLSYLRANGFKTYIVSGGTIDFMRPWSQAAYGIPPERVIGSSQAIRYTVQDGKPVLLREPKLDFIGDGPGKPIGIYRNIGRQPILAVGNSDGDFQMLEYTTGGSGARMGVLIRHDDAEREFAYDRASHFGKLDKALDAAPAKGWVVVSMKRDWQQIYPPAGR
ncbi:HAD family hydrolase [Cupriavidus sp. RAF12]